MKLKYYFLILVTILLFNINCYAASRNSLSNLNGFNKIPGNTVCVYSNTNYPKENHQYVVLSISSDSFDYINPTFPIINAKNGTRLTSFNFSGNCSDYQVNIVDNSIYFGKNSESDCDTCTTSWNTDYIFTYDSDATKLVLGEQVLESDATENYITTIETDSDCKFKVGDDYIPCGEYKETDGLGYFISNNTKVCVSKTIEDGNFQLTKIDGETFNPDDWNIAVNTLFTDINANGSYSCSHYMFKKSEDISNVVDQDVKDVEFKFNSEEYKTCRDLFGNEFLKLLDDNIFKLIYIGIPILLILLTTFEFAKVVFSDDKDGMANATKNFRTRVIVAILIYLVPKLLILIGNTIDRDNYALSCAKYYNKIDIVE